MPPKTKACKVKHVDEVASLEHGPRQCQERERSITPNGGEISEVANKIYARIARAVQGGECRREGCSFREFHKQSPPNFNDEPDPMAAKNWLLKMEKLLKALECTNAQKVVYATFALHGSAEEWWTNTKCLLRMELGENTPITWEKFKEVFNETYFPKCSEGPKASGVGTFTETIKRSMRLEEDFKCNPSSKEDEKNQEPFGFLHVEGLGQNSKKGFFKKSSNGGHYNGQGKGAFPLFGAGSSSIPQSIKNNDDGKRVHGRLYALTTQDAQVRIP
nr:hypothetical protein CFP56_02246 [Quercus suber]